MHNRDIYPEVKEKSSLDAELAKGTGDRAYLTVLRARLPAVFRKAAPDLVVYNAGVDVYRGDQLGGLKLTAAGVRKRDELVFAECFGRGVPVALVLSGGYAARPGATARLHAATMEAALKMHGHRQRNRELGGKMKMLMAEDNPDVVLMETILAAQGYAVECSTAGGV